MHNCNNFFSKRLEQFNSRLLLHQRSARLNHNLSPGVRRGSGAVGLQATATRGTGPRATIPLTFCRARVWSGWPPSHGDAGDRPPALRYLSLFVGRGACPSPTPSTGDRQEPANLPNRPDGSSGAPAPEEAGSGELALQNPHLVNPVNPDSEKKKNARAGHIKVLQT